MRPLLLALAAALLLPRLAHAGAITLETTLKVDVGDAVRVTLTVRNRGNDTAGDVNPKLRFVDAVRNGQLVDHMPPQASHEWVLEFPRPEHAGRYPLLSTVAYIDPGSRAFSAVAASLVDVGGVYPSRVRGMVSKLALDGDGTLDVTVQSDDPETRPVTLTALLPEELGGVQDVGRVKPGRGQPAMLTIPIQNHGALPGSHYPVYAVARTTEGDHETAALLLGSVDVAAAAAVDWQAYLPQAAILLAGLFVVGEITQRVRARSRQPETPPPRSGSRRPRR